jgi:hypothetical protein
MDAVSGHGEDVTGLVGGGHGVDGEGDMPGGHQSPYAPRMAVVGDDGVGGHFIGRPGRTGTATGGSSLSGGVQHFFDSLDPVIEQRTRFLRPASN